MDMSGVLLEVKNTKKVVINCRSNTKNNNINLGPPNKFCTRASELIVALTKQQNLK